MHTRSKGCARIDMDDHFIPVFRLYFLPGRDDQNVVHIELFEILFPVVDPVLILRLGFCKRAGAQIGKRLQFFQRLFDFHHHRRDIIILIEIKTYLRHALIRRKLRQNVDEHSLRLFLGQRDIILNLNALDAEFIQCVADEIHRLCGGRQRKFLPFHVRYLSLLKRLISQIFTFHHAAIFSSFSL